MRSIAILLLLVSFSRAEIVTQKIEYKDGETVLEGVVVYDSEAKGDRPAFLIVHQWMGITEHEITYAQRLAKDLQVVAFVADIYGKGVRPKNAQEARAQATKYRSGDGKLYRRRLLASFHAMRAQKSVRKEQCFAVGFCFGGTGVLELARSGAPLLGVVSFHGGLKTALPAREGSVRCQVLACHGGKDPIVPDAEVAAFMKEMREAKAVWKLIAYGGAAHAFTQKSANRKDVAEYNEKAAKQSWRDMIAFYLGCFPKKK